MYYCTYIKPFYCLAWGIAVHVEVRWYSLYMLSYINPQAWQFCSVFLRITVINASCILAIVEVFVCLSVCHTLDLYQNGVS